MAALTGNINTRGVTLRYFTGSMMLFIASLGLLANVVLRPGLPIRMLVFLPAWMAFLMFMQARFRT